eukprot:7361666-Pyramimonas_sp.AAC.1
MVGGEDSEGMNIRSYRHPLCGDQRGHFVLFGEMPVGEVLHDVRELAHLLHQKHLRPLLPLDGTQGVQPPHLGTAREPNRALPVQGQVLLRGSRRGFIDQV